ncbi:hypothetical protein YC2023_011070 [Brassica napus]
MERASRDEPSYISLPEHANLFTQTKLAPEIYTKDEINEMFYGVCGEQEKNKEAFQMKLDGVYYPLNESISWLTTCMEEMKQDIARIQHATDVARSSSIDRDQHASINISQIDRQSDANIGAVPERLGVEPWKVFGFIAASYSGDCLRTLQEHGALVGTWPNGHVELGERGSNGGHMAGTDGRPGFIGCELVDEDGPLGAKPCLGGCRVDELWSWTSSTTFFREVICIGILPLFLRSRETPSCPSWTSARSLGHQTPLSIVLGCTCGRSERIHSLIGDISPGEWAIILNSIQTRGLDQVVMRRCPHGGDWSELAESLMDKPGTQDFSLHFWSLSGSMNCVEKCMGLRAGGTFSMFFLVIGDNLVDSWYRRRILRHVVCESEDLEIHPSETHGSWVRFFINRRLYGLSSRNLDTGWTFVLEPEGWMDYRPRTWRLDGLSSRNPEAGRTLILEPVGCRVLLSILRSYLDPEVMWEPGGSPFDPEIVSGPGGHVGTRRHGGRLGTLKVPSGPGGRLGTRRFLLDPEVISNPEVALDPEVVWEPGGSSRPGGTVLRLPRQDYSRKSLTGLEGAGVGVMTQVPGFAAFHVWRSRVLIAPCISQDPDAP